MQLQTSKYNRNFSVDYAHQWAYSRNPKYDNFNEMGGDCTNFISQCIFAGCNIMNYSPVYGWYYIDLRRRTASWTGVEFLFDFLTKNISVGPYGQQVELAQIEIGDVIQIGFENEHIFEHSVIVVKIVGTRELENIYVATHSVDRDNYNLSNYNFKNLRFIHIQGLRRRKP